MTYLLLRQLHTLAAMIAIGGFLLRGYWMLTGSAHLERRFIRIAPHIVDTVFLFSGIAMLVTISLNPFTEAWLLAKFAGLVLYIALGMIALRRGTTIESRALAFIAAIATYAYVVGVALAKSPASWLRYLA